jgi:hypothetical protein
MKGIAKIINLLEGNPYHEPAGTSIGGHFAHAPSGNISPKDIDPDVSIQAGDEDIKTASGIIWKRTYQGDYYFFVTVHGDDGEKKYKVKWLTKDLIGTVGVGFEYGQSLQIMDDAADVVFEDAIVFPVTPSTLADYAMEKIKNLGSNKVGGEEPEIINNGPPNDEPLKDVMGRAGVVDVPADRIKGIPFPGAQKSWDVSKMAKDKICEEVAKEAGVEYHDVDQILQSWAESAVSNNSLMVHKTIADIMGYNLTDKLQEDLRGIGIESSKSLGEQDDRIINAWVWDYAVRDRALGNPSDGRALPAAKTLPAMTAQKLQKVVETVYERTQEFLAGKNIGKYDYVKVYRGVKYPQTKNPIGYEGKIIEYGGKPVASWSTRLGTAKNFGQGGSGMDGYVLETYVPRWTIFSTAMTGIGCLGESEVLVFGDNLGHLVRIKEEA